MIAAYCIRMSSLLGKGGATGLSSKSNGAIRCIALPLANMATGPAYIGFLNCVSGHGEEGRRPWPGGVQAPGGSSLAPSPYYFRPGEGASARSVVCESNEQLVCVCDMI